MAYDAFLSYLIDNAPDVFQTLSRSFPQMMTESISPLSSAERFGESASGWGAGLTESPQDLLTRMKAQKAIGAREEEQGELADARARANTAAEEQKAALQKETNQRSLAALTGGPDSGVQYPADKLREIRAQAKAKGRAGSLGYGGDPLESDYGSMGGGGGFSQAAPSAELDARLKETNEWAALQPERDLQFLASAEQSRRDPELAMSAADQLTGLREARSKEELTALEGRRIANQEALIGSLTKSGGKVPFETAMKMDVAGLKVPAFAIGMSRPAAKKKLEEWRAGALQSINEGMLENLPPGTMDYLEYVLQLIPQYGEMIDRGDDPDKTLADLWEIIQRHGVESGARAVQDRRMAAAKARQEAQ